MKKYISKHKIPLILFAVCLLLAVGSGLYLSIINERNTDSRYQIADSNNTAINQESEKAKNQLLITNYHLQSDNTTTSDKDLTTTTYNLKPSTSSSPVLPHPDETNTFIPQPQQFSDFMTLKVNGKERMIPITTSTTVYEMMSYYQMISSDSDFQFETKDFSAMGKFVTKIGGVENNENNSGKYWIYYINGESAKTGISNYILKPNDLIEWKYETSNF